MRVDIEDVGHQFDRGPFLFRQLSGVLHENSLYAVVGPSGCGKTTLLSILAGWLQPSAGRVRMRGISRIQWVFQNPYGIARRSAVDHVLLPLRAGGATRLEAERAAEQLFEDFGLASVSERAYADLSGGEAQRLMLARALAGGPDLLLVDEPTAQLDLRTGAAVSRTLSSLSMRRCIVVIATHDPNAMAACDHVLDLTRTQDVAIS
jgi:ABC-type lipoprotein export system ATPase subunit